MYKGVPNLSAKASNFAWGIEGVIATVSEPEFPHQEISGFKLCQFNLIPVVVIVIFVIFLLIVVIIVVFIVVFIILVFVFIFFLLIISINFLFLKIIIIFF